MLTAAIYGQLFTPPTRTEILESIRFLNNGHGVFIIVKKFRSRHQKNLARPLILLDKKELRIGYSLAHAIFLLNLTIDFKLEEEDLQGLFYFIKF